MREIRFRIWHINDREAYEVVSINFELGIWYHDHIHGESQWASFDECVIEQFTGLQDKNSNDIYEGDIVDNGNTVVYSDRSTKRFANVGTVKHDVKNGCIVINNSNGYTNRLTEKTIKENKISVIGNIHEVTE